MERSHTSIIPLSLIFTANASGFSFLPLHSLQGVSNMNRFSHSLFASDSVSKNIRCKLFSTPSKLSEYSQYESLDFDSYL